MGHLQWRIETNAPLPRGVHGQVLHRISNGELKRTASLSQTATLNIVRISNGELKHAPMTALCMYYHGVLVHLQWRIETFIYAIRHLEVAGLMHLQWRIETRGCIWRPTDAARTAWHLQWRIETCRRRGPLWRLSARGHLQWRIETSRYNVLTSRPRSRGISNGELKL